MTNELIKIQDLRQEEFVKEAKKKLQKHPDIKKLKKLAVAVHKYTGEDLYLVWGTVRNVLLNLPINDFDITSSIRIDDLQRVMDIENNKNILLNRKFSPKKHWVYKYNVIQEALGILSIYIKGAKVGGAENPMQYAQFRIEKEYNTVRIPTDVVLGTTLENDSLRRDCTINAIYYNLRTNCFVDPQNGIEDLFSWFIVNNDWENNIFTNDPLRIFRVVRMQAMLMEQRWRIEKAVNDYKESIASVEMNENTYVWQENSNTLLLELFDRFNPNNDIRIEEGTLNQLKWALDDIKKLPKARIIDELIKWAKYKNYFRLLSNYWILSYLHENFELAKDLDQKTKHHKYDTLEHILKVVEAGYELFPWEEPGFYLGLLFHDIGKPTQFLESRKYPIKSNEFYQAKEEFAHEVVWGQIARDFFQNTPNEIAQKIFCITERHQDEIFYIHDSFDIFENKNLENENLIKAEKKFLSKIEYTVIKLSQYVEKNKIEYIEPMWNTLMKAHYCDKVGSGIYDNFDLLNKQRDFLNYMFNKYYKEKEINNYRIAYQVKERINKELIPHYSSSMKDVFYNRISEAIYNGKIKKDFESIEKLFKQMAWNKNPVLNIIPNLRFNNYFFLFQELNQALRENSHSIKSLKKNTASLDTVLYCETSIRRGNIVVFYANNKVIEGLLVKEPLPSEMKGIDIDNNKIITGPVKNKWFIIYKKLNICFAMNSIKNIDIVINYLDDSEKKIITYERKR